jgi:hypothetical protein
VTDQEEAKQAERQGHDVGQSSATSAPVQKRRNDEARDQDQPRHRQSFSDEGLAQGIYRTEIRIDE